MDDHMGDDWFGPDAATFGDRVAGAREQAGMTQTELAKRLGVKKSTLNGWEQDLSEPRANKLQMMAGMLNVSITWLLTGEGEGSALPADVGLADETPGDLSQILRDLQGIRVELRAVTERTAKLEKRLRNAIGTRTYE
ncbi:MAG: helix-turn-helix transcriptional regulator [Rhodobacteraceae bacterium]|nr:helix-turn-helix transcriptional regulator [Paracoccaceae bacterium]